MPRSDFAENKLDGTAYNTSGLIHVVSTNQTTMSSLRLSTPCSSGIVTRSSAMSTCPTFRVLPLLSKSPASCPRNRHFGIVDGSLGDGPFKSLLRQH